MARILQTPPPTDGEDLYSYLARLLEELDYRMGEVDKEIKTLESEGK